MQQEQACRAVGGGGGGGGGGDEAQPLAMGGMLLAAPHFKRHMMWSRPQALGPAGSSAVVAQQGAVGKGLARPWSSRSAGANVSRQARLPLAVTPGLARSVARVAAGLVRHG
jgi:hypothetical protein